MGDKKPITLGGIRRFWRHRPWWRKLIGFEEFLSSFIADWLSKRRLVRALEFIGKLTLLAALVSWIYPGCKERRQSAESAKQAAADAKTSRH